MIEQKPTKPKYEKLAGGILVVLGVLMIVLTILKNHPRIWAPAEQFREIVFVCAMPVYAYLNWQQHRGLAWLALFAVFAIVLLEIFV